MRNDVGLRATANVPPHETLRLLKNRALKTQLMYVVVKLGIADLLNDGPRSSQELAQAIDVDAPALQRILRGLVTLGVFIERDDGRFALNAAAELLQTSRLPNSFISETEGRWSHAVGALLHTVRTGETAFKRASGMSLFEYLAHAPEESEDFYHALGFTAQQLAPALVAAYDFGPIRRIVDVGGGHGELIAAILVANPQMTGILFDLPSVIRKSSQRLQRAGVADRCKVVPGDFFQSLPRGSDAYLLAWVIHDWDDECALRVLRNCRAAMREDSKLLLVEAVMSARAEQVDESLLARQANPFLLDISMLLNTGGRERTETAYQALLTKAGFTLTRVVPVRSTRNVSVIEGVPIRR